MFIYYGEGPEEDQGKDSYSNKGVKMYWLKPRSEVVEENYISISRVEDLNKHQYVSSSTQTLNIMLLVQTLFTKHVSSQS